MSTNPRELPAMLRPETAAPPSLEATLQRLRRATENAILCYESGDQVVVIACFSELDSAFNAARAARLRSLS